MTYFQSIEAMVEEQEPDTQGQGQCVRGSWRAELNGGMMRVSKAKETYKGHAIPLMDSHRASTARARTVWLQPSRNGFIFYPFIFHAFYRVPLKPLSSVTHRPNVTSRA